MGGSIGRMSGIALVFLGLSWTASAQEKAPATAAEAAKVLDLAALPLAPGAKPVGVRRSAELFYEAASKVKDAFEFHRKQLIDAGWTEAPQSTVMDESASATFTKNGYVVSLAAFSTGQPGQVNVSFTFHGNVDVSKLPIPEGAKPLYVGPVTAMLVTETPPAQVATFCKEALTKLGWEPYGQAGDSRFYRRNAVLITVTANAAPAQDGKTMLAYSAKLMSVELPPPADALDIQYADTTTTLAFDAKSSVADVFSKYRETLEKLGWKATTEQPFKSGFRREMIFRNPAKDMLTLQVHEFEGKARGTLRHQSGKEVEESEKRFEAKLAETKAKSGSMRKAEIKARPAQALPIPGDAAEVKVSGSSASFKPAQGKTTEAVEAIRAALAKDGWKDKGEPIAPMAGAITFSRGDDKIVVSYVDVGVVPGQVTVSGFGIDLTKAEAK